MKLKNRIKNNKINKTNKKHKNSQNNTTKTYTNNLYQLICLVINQV